MGLAAEPARTAVLRPGEVVEVFGPDAALGPTPGTRSYPVAETFRIRAMYSQPGPQHLHYSSWITIQSVIE
jgi:hypothetical protein